MTDQIKQTARRHLAERGPDISLRAVAREVGVVSSAVYRYFPSRDDLLTELIIDAYDSLADAAEAAEASAPRRDALARWMALGRGMREWALANRHEYALLYGSPVPGYAAPQDTIGPAMRPVLVVVDIVRDAVAAGSVAAPSGRLPRALRDDIEQMSATPGLGGLPPAVFARVMTAWAQVFGAISFELFGRLQNGITDYETFFDYQLRAMAAHVGL